MSGNGNALNVIGKPYNADAVLIGNAFYYAQREPAKTRGEFIYNYPRDNGSDRRYRIFFNAATSNLSSAIVTYKGRRYYVDGIYDANAHERTFYVYRSHND